MPNRLRNEDCQFQVFVNGDRLVGTRIRIMSWSLTLGVSLESEEYTGEKGERHHEVYKNGQFDFSGRPIRPVWPVLADFIQKRARGEVTGQIDIHLTGRFRSSERERVKLINCFGEDPSMSGQGHELVEERYQGKASIVDIKPN